MNADGHPRILIVRVGAMGDVLHGMPAVAALRAALPEAEIGWAVEPRWSPLLCAQSNDVPSRATLPLVDCVHLVEAKTWSKQPFSMKTLNSVRSLRQALRAAQYDIAIDLQGSIRSAIIARLSGAPRVIGNANPREWPARLFYTQSVPVHAAHVVEQAAEIVSAAIGQPLQPQPAALPHDAAAEPWCNAILGDDTRPIVFLAPTAGWGAKQWPLARFAAVAVACSRAGLRVLVNKAGPRDVVADELLHAASGHAEPVYCTVSQLIALTRRVSLAIAGDTGPLHLAAALGKPTVALFGPTDPARNGPFGAPSRVLRSTSSVTDHRRHGQVETGLANIPVEDVLAAAADLLRIDIPCTGATADALRG